MNKQTFLEYNETIGWDYAIEQLAKNNQDKRLRDLIDIYYIGEILRAPRVSPSSFYNLYKILSAGRCCFR